jgi:anti-anti-sigma factor
MSETFAEISFRETEVASIVTFSGEIDETNADRLFKDIYSKFVGTRLIFDFSGLQYGNSKFIGYVASMHEYIEEKEGKMAICNCRGTIYDTLDLA